MNPAENFIKKFDQLVADAKSSQRTRLLKQQLAFGKKLKNPASKKKPAPKKVLNSEIASIFHLADFR